MLSIRHPITNTPTRFIAPLPKDLHDLISRLRTLPNATEFLDPPPQGSILTIPSLLGE
jgi:hypothetical protein